MEHMVDHMKQAGFSKSETEKAKKKLEEAKKKADPFQ